MRNGFGSEEERKWVVLNEGPKCKSKARFSRIWFDSQLIESIQLLHWIILNRFKRLIFQKV